MKAADQYHRFVRWSAEDQIYIGYCPDLDFTVTDKGSIRRLMREHLTQ